MSRNRLVIFAWLAFCGLVTLNFSACAKKQVKKTTDEEQAKDEEVSSEELDIHGKDFVSSKNLATINFEYDSSELSVEARKILASNADYLKKTPDIEVLAEGHTDERGTVGYNLALGQRRAQAVRKYYAALGIKPKKIGSLSYGKEKPACAENTEECWAANRRVETKIRAPKVVNGNQKEHVPEEDPAAAPR